MMKPSTPLSLFGSAVLAVITPSLAGAEVLVDFGLNSTQVSADIANATSIAQTTSSGYHIGAGVRRALKRGSIGARLELEDVDSNLLIAVRALDYKHSFSERLSIGGFFGAARLDLATPAYGYWLGGAIEYDFSAHWAISFDLRIGDKLARDNLLPSDPQGGRPDNFYDLRGIGVYLSRRF
jgi:hypothetical protein